MLDNLFNSTQGTANVNPLTALINLVIIFVLALLIALVYKKTHRGLSYSQSFLFTLIIAGMVICAVMMVIGNNIARAFGAFGAFSLIRFRTAIKDAKDMGFIFLVLAVGMAVGTNNYAIAVIATAAVLLIIMILNRLNFGSIRKFDYILGFILDTKKTSENSYKIVADKYLKSINLLNIKAKEGGQILQLTFSIKFVSENESAEFVSNLEKIEGISEVNLITAKNDIEY